MRSYFLKTARIGFSNWNKHDLDLADKLWGNSDVTQFISKNGHYTTQVIESRLKREIKNQMLYNVQYFPIFCLETQYLIGCCGLVPVSNQKNTYELGFHLRKNYWGKGLFYEASQAIIDYSFTKINVDTLKAGHHPLNTNSKSLLLKLGFQYEADLYYPPTGLDHPSYYLKKIRSVSNLTYWYSLTVSSLFHQSQTIHCHNQSSSHISYNGYPKC